MKNSGRRNPEDKRVQITKQLLRTALISLLAKKNLCDIRVKELCETACVNRSTFYAHYADLHGLAKEMEAELLRDLEGMLRRIPFITRGATEREVKKVAEELYGFIEKHRDFCAVLLGQHGDQSFIQEAVEKGHAKAMREYMRRYPALTRQRANIAYAFVAWGVIGLLNYAIVNDLSAEATAEALACGAACQMEYLMRQSK